MEFLNMDELAEALDNTLNGDELENVIAYGLGNIYPNTLYVFKTHPETGEYLHDTRIGNTVHRYINGELSLIDASSEGIGESTYNAIINVKCDFLIPLAGNEKRNKLLISSIRQLLTEKLKYTVSTDEEYNGLRYTHIVSYDIATTGMRMQRDVAGDSINLSVYITHTFVALGVSSNLIKMQVYNHITGEWEDVAYSKLGIGRKSVCESNIYSDQTSDDAFTAAKNVPINSLLTISVALLTRMYYFDFLVDQYTYWGELSAFKIRLVRPNIPKRFYPDDSAEDEQRTEYNMIFDTSGINAELDAISSTSVTLIETREAY